MGRVLISAEEMESDEGIIKGLMRTRHMLIDNLEKVLVMEAIISGDISIDDVNTSLLLKIGGQRWRKGLPTPPQSGPIGKLIYDMKLLQKEPCDEGGDDMKLNKNTGTATFKSTLQNYNNEFNGLPPCTVRRIPKEGLEMFTKWAQRDVPVIEIEIVSGGGGLSFCRRVSSIEDITWMFPEVEDDRVYKIAWHHDPRDVR